MNEAGGLQSRPGLLGRIRRPFRLLSKLSDAGIAALLIESLLFLSVLLLSVPYRTLPFNSYVLQHYGRRFYLVALAGAGVLALRAFANSSKSTRRAGCAAFLGVPALLLLLILASIPQKGLERSLYPRGGCEDQLQSIFHLAESYAQDDEGIWPPIPEEPGSLAYPISLARIPLERSYLQCSAQIPHPGLFDLFTPDKGYSAAFPAGDAYFWYLGHTVVDEAQGMAFIEAYRRHVAQKLSLTGDFESGTDGRPVYRLSRQAIENLQALPSANTSVEELLRRLPRRMPVIIERPRHLINGRPGGYVLFYDGHIEWMPYPGEFPMTERFIKGLESLDSLKRDAVKR